MTQLFAVTVKTAARKTHVEKCGENEYCVWLKEKPIKGMANRALLAAFALYFSIPRSLMRIKSGQRARRKIIELDT